ncbi:MAG: dinuclear metal center YbgI/SA1388 family protein [Hyphomicrobiaceae bacterium]|jgi:dinuclear metal center YbgI/SA1388 family protein
MSAPTLDDVLDILHEIAPLELAADWDNVGVLLRPNVDASVVSKCMLTIDLTEAVIEEAKAFGADLVVSYHPPIFKPFARLDAHDPTQRRVLAAIAAGFVVYSPHTALDAAAGGLADWLIEGALGADAPEALRPCGDGEFGRVAELAKPLAFRTLLERLKKLYGVKHLQVAKPVGMSTKVRSIAVAAGAGSSVLRGTGADVYVTGEMSHHDVLAAVADGVAVVLAGHTNTERGFLGVLGKRLTSEFGKGIQVRVAKEDRDPLSVI